MIFAGIDIGSTTTETVLLDEKQRIVASSWVLTGIGLEAAADETLQQCLAQSGHRREEIGYCVSTGYGRELVEYADSDFTEIACHAKGANYWFPEARGVIDIGGQDSKAISINTNGGIMNFAMNDKCAAGTGRFLEVMARIMGLDVEEMGRQSLLAERATNVSSICTVFAESEVISLLAKKASTPCEIMAGIHESVVRRVHMLVQKAQLSVPIVMTGGVARNIGVVKSFEKVLETKLLIPEDPQSIGALGAAIIAHSQYRKKENQGKRE